MAVLQPVANCKSLDGSQLVPHDCVEGRPELSGPRRVCGLHKTDPPLEVRTKLRVAMPVGDSRSVLAGVVQDRSKLVVVGAVNVEVTVHDHAGKDLALMRSTSSRLRLSESESPRPE